MVLEIRLSRTVFQVISQILMEVKDLFLSYFSVDLNAFGSEQGVKNLSNFIYFWL